MNLPKLSSLLESLVAEDVGYHNIGHGPDDFNRERWNEDSWVMFNDSIYTAKQLYAKNSRFRKYVEDTKSKDFEYDGHIEDSLHPWVGDSRKSQATGRIDHNKNTISAVIWGQVSKDYIKRLMELDYPNYRVVFF